MVYVRWADRKLDPAAAELAERVLAHADLDGGDR